MKENKRTPASRGTMSEEITQQVQEQKPNDKEYNFRQIEKQLMKEREEKAQERAAREELEREIQRLRNAHSNADESDEDAEPYVDHKRLNKKLAKFGEQQEKHTESKIQTAVQTALREERKQNWIKNNPDFYEVLQHADKFAQLDPELAETILEMPEGFERQKLVYKNIKALGIHKPEQKQPSIQEKIDSNRRSPYYQPTGVAAAPYAGAGDFSEVGQQSAYKKMQELKNRLRI